MADPVLVLKDAGFHKPHPEQISVLRNWRRDHMLLWSRQGGKSTVGATIAVHNLLFNASSVAPYATVPIVSRAQHQSGELFQTARKLYGALPYAPPLVVDSATVMRTPDGGRILAYPGSEESVRGLSAVTIALIDEATLVEESLRNAVTPMLATTNAPLWCMGTAKGEAGWFYDDWHNSDLDFIVKSKVVYSELKHLPAEFFERERRRMPSWQFRQEYGCEFLADGDEFLIRPEVIDRVINSDIRPLW